MASVLDKFVKGLIGGKSKNPVNLIAGRFIRVFEDHGVPASQIPRLLPQIQFSDLKSEDTLLLKINGEVLDHAAQLFGIRRQWLEGIDDQIYEVHCCYKFPNEFFSDLASFCHRKDTGLYLPVRVFTTRDHLDYTNKEKQPLALILVEQFAILNDKKIFRYRVFNDEWNWSNVSARIQVKAMTRLISTVLHVPVPLYVIEPNEMEALYNGTIVPHQLIGNRWISDPSLEDYAVANSHVGKEQDELPAVMEYIEEYQLKNLITEDQGKCVPILQESGNSSIQSAKPIKAHGSGKRAKNQEDVWMPARKEAQKLWYEDDSLSISEVIRSIKANPNLKASELTESAIRKKIADLAPENIRGKPGRKRK